MSQTTLPRSLVGELMDSPAIDPVEHRRALAGLRRINQVSNTAQTLLVPLMAFAKRRGVSRLSLLDVACGGGDVPVGLARLARRRGVSVDLTLLDVSATALEQAERGARAAGISVTVRQGNAVESLPREMCDVVTNSLFLHHLTGEETTRVLGQMREAARELVVISDLRRCKRGLVLAQVACRVLSRSPVVHFDGPASVRAAWTTEELRAMALAAGLDGVRIGRDFPFRILLEWERRGSRQ